MDVLVSLEAEPEPIGFVTLDCSASFADARAAIVSDGLLLAQPAWGGGAIRSRHPCNNAASPGRNQGGQQRDTAAGLHQALPGVGPKMALIVLRVNTGEVI